MIELIDRGIIDNCNNIQLLEEYSKNPSNIGFYFGIDLTGPDLHVGHLLPMRLAQILSDAGFKNHCVLGHATTMIGDPTGKISSRPIIEHEEILQNGHNILNTVKNIFNQDIAFVNNMDWLKEIKLLEFLRHVGQKIPLTRLLSQTTVQKRLKSNSHMSFLEFAYPILQGYDFAYLAQNNNVLIQIGGSDQWFNMLQGVELAKKLYNKDVVVITVPLLENSKGEKIGKTAQNATIWLNKYKTSPFEFWQFWRNIDDDITRKYYKIFCPTSSVKKLDNNVNKLKEKLAIYITQWIYGEQIALDAYKTSKEIFNKGSDIPVIGTYSAIQTTKLDASLNGITVVDLMYKYNITASKAEAKRLIKDFGIKMNNELVSDIGHLVPFDNKVIEIRVGKKKIFLFEVCQQNTNLIDSAENDYTEK